MQIKGSSNIDDYYASTLSVLFDYYHSLKIIGFQLVCEAYHSTPPLYGMIES